jgi:hypothetical protein
VEAIQPLTSAAKETKEVSQSQQHFIPFLEAFLGSFVLDTTKD